MERPGQHRDIVFCHQCENEWNRDEHGLDCPECHSDFTEIIEADNDPRQDYLNMDDDGELPPLEQIRGHHPWQDAQDAPDPEEGDINQLQWRRTGPHSITIQGTFTRDMPMPMAFGAGGGGMRGPPPPMMYPNPVMQNFATMLHGIAGANAAGPRNFEDGQREGTPRPSGTRVHIGTNVPFRSPAEQQQPGQLGDGREQIPQLLAQILGGMDEAHNGPHGAHTAPNPFAQLFASILNPAVAMSGDAVYSQEAFDRVISQLMEQNPGGTAPGPASAEAIRALHKKKVDKSMLDETTGKAECSICMDNVDLGEEVSNLPCNHWFHHDCVKSWLQEHDSCPQCRTGIMPKEGQGNRPRAGDQAALNNQNAWAGGGSGTRANPWGRQDERQRSYDRRRSSGSRRGQGNNNAQGNNGGGGLTDRVRSFFGGSSNADR